MHLTTEEKKAVFKEFGGSDTNTGSMEAQVVRPHGGRFLFFNQHSGNPPTIDKYEQSNYSNHHNG